MVNLNQLIRMFIAFILLLINIEYGMAQNDDKGQAFELNPPMSMLPMNDGGRGSGAAKGANLDVLVDALDLRRYEEVFHNSLACAKDVKCFKLINKINQIQNIAAACSGNNKSSKGPLSYVDLPVENLSVSKKVNLSNVICQWIKSPGKDTRQALIEILPGLDESSIEKTTALVESEAYMSAVNGDAVACENTIKNYVGPYGSNWNSNWYRDLSGCRILAGVRTLSEEKKDFYTWFKLIKGGSGTCADIVNIDMRSACSAAGAASPLSV